MIDPAIRLEYGYHVCAVGAGFMYLTAVIDWYSRYVLSWRLSNTLDGSFCLELLDEALAKGRPEIFNTDQGVAVHGAGVHRPFGGGRVRSAWMARALRWTTCSWSGCGGR